MTNYYDANGRKTTDEKEKKRKRPQQIELELRFAWMAFQQWLCISFHLIAFVRGAWNAIPIFCLVRFQSCFWYWVSKMKMYFNNSSKKRGKRKWKGKPSMQCYKSTSKHLRQMLQFEKNVSFALFINICGLHYILHFNGIPIIRNDSIFQCLSLSATHWLTHTMQLVG